MQLKYIIFTLFITISSLTSYGQNCSEYHINKCRWADESFLYSRQSKSAMFVAGMTSEFSITVYSGEEYYVSIKGDRKLGDIRVRIKEDNEEKSLLYDNADYEYEDFLFFKNENTRNLLLQVSSEAEGKFSNSSDRYCVGVLIEFRTYEDKETSTGF